ncbi:MAG: LTA synthase family protein [Eubacterium sp.]|nr:LTA synthase family protein [Eubacterium sp.]
MLKDVLLKLKKTYSNKEIAAAWLLLSANVLIGLTIWMSREYDQIRFDQILFQLKSTSAGAQSALLGRAILQVGVLPTAATLLEMRLYPIVAAFVRKRVLSLAFVLLSVAGLLFTAQMDIYAYMRADAMKSTFIRSHYVKPADSILHFPEQKRNLVYIFLESMESTYADPAAGEQITACYIPELEDLAAKNLNFSHTDGLGGALPFPGTTWTAAAMVAQTSGVNVKVALGEDTYGAEDAFLPGVTSIGQILEKQGYNQTLLLGSDAEFNGRKAFFTEHGNYKILDTESLKKTGRLPEDYNEWWGFEDEKLFAYAKEELLRLADEDAPFNLTLLTADTHFPDGYCCDLCEDKYDNPYANVLACSSRQVAAFVSWIQEQPFYENTTIVISGDHLTMDAAFMDDIDPDYTRTVYDCIIHAAEEPVMEKNRQFATFDLFPTTLAALGVKIDGDRLALGTNLFSDQQTLTEQYGYDYLSEELQKQSDFYEEELLAEPA